MSLTLIVWKQPLVRTEEEAGSLVHRFYESDDPSIYLPSEEVLRFYDELLQRYPPLESYTVDESRDTQSPWSSTPDRSDRKLELNIRWRTLEDVLDTIVDLAPEYELVLYDPQGPSLHSPVGEDEPADVAGR